MMAIMQPSPYIVHDRDTVTCYDQRPRKYVGRIKDLPENEKPRERLINHGVEILSVAELLAIIFVSGTKKEGVLEMTSRIVREYGDKGLAHERDPQKLSQELEIPINKAIQIIACFNLGKRVFKSEGINTFIRSAKDAYEYLTDMRHLPKEQLRGLYLNSRYQLIHDEIISIGTLTSNVVHPREVFQPALQYAAAGIVIVHNHPSGDASPTEADREITEQLIQAGKILGIDILDHVVVTKNSYQSVDAHYYV